MFAYHQDISPYPLVTRGHSLYMKMLEILNRAIALLNVDQKKMLKRERMFLLINTHSFLATIIESHKNSSKYPAIK